MSPAERRAAGEVFVFGSINIDLAARVSELPKPGETLFGSGFAISLGGKGANQAVAAARMGAKTRMTGRIGGDVFGRDAKARLEAYGVDVSAVKTDTAHPTGIALIHIDSRGQNSITVISGANGGVEAADFDGEKREPVAERRARPVLLLQGETPLSASIAAAKAARAAGWTVIVDPAPPQPLASLAPLIRLASLITPNEHETRALTGISPETQADCARAAAVLREAGAETVIIKRGGQGVYVSAGGESFSIPAPPVQAVDTTGAGDCFAGALGACLAEGLALGVSLRLAVTAASLSVTRAGAADSMPPRAEVEAAVKAARSV